MDEEYKDSGENHFCRIEREAVVQLSPSHERRR